MSQNLEDKVKTLKQEAKKGPSNYNNRILSMIPKVRELLKQYNGNVTKVSAEVKISTPTIVKIKRDKRLAIPPLKPYAIFGGYMIDTLDVIPKVHKLLKQHNWNFQRVAEELKISPPTVAKIAHDKNLDILIPEKTYGGHRWNLPYGTLKKAVEAFAVYGHFRKAATKMNDEGYAISDTSIGNYVRIINAILADGEKGRKNLIKRGICATELIEMGDRIIRENGYKDVLMTKKGKIPTFHRLA
jgi:hypothetical protein